MKKIKIITIIIATFFIIMPKVNAASIYTSASTVYPGQSFNASVTINAAAWNVHSSTSGPVSGCVMNDADSSPTAMNMSKTVSVSCTATGTGTITISLYGDYTTQDGNNVALGGTATVQVIPQPAPQPQPQPQNPKPQTPAQPQPQVQKSNNNYLKSLSVEGCSISPEFNKNTLEYSCKDLMIDKITINAAVEDSKAYLTGTGEKELFNGDNNFEVSVTSEDGQVRVYKLLINKKNIPSTKILKLGLGNQEYKIDDEIILFGLPSGTEKIDLKVTTDSTTANVNINGNENLKPGHNIVTITVTDTDCVDKIYKVLVYVQELDELENKNIEALDKDYIVNLKKNAAYLLNKTILNSLGSNKVKFHIIDNNYGLLASMDVNTKQQLENDYELYFILKNDKIYTNIFKETDVKAYLGNKYKIGKKLYIYAYNDIKQKYELLTSQKYNDYYVSFKTTDSFEYLVTDKEITEIKVEKKISAMELIIVIVSQVVIMVTIIALFVAKFKKNYKISQEENAIISPVVTEEKPVIIEATVETVESKENTTTEEPPKVEEDKTENKESEVI